MTVDKEKKTELPSLDIGPAIPGPFRGQYQAFTATEATDSQREQARELVRTWVELRYFHKANDRKECIEGTVASVTEDGCNLIVDLILRIQ